MNLLTSYALTAGQTVDKINILEKFYPLNLEKFILFHPWSKPSKCYSLWQDVIDILHPILKDHNLPLVQVGLNTEPLLPNCIDLRGRTSVNQCAYLCSKAILGLLCDSFVSHLAGHYDIPRVILISNNRKECVKPFFGSPEKEIILEPDRTKKNPSYQLDEGPNKQINEIKPEKIAESVLKLLYLPFNFPYETVYVGENYTSKILESVPKGITRTDNINVDSIVVRMDYEFNEQVLVAQMQYIPVTIVTNKSVNLELLKNYKPRIKQIFYVVEKENSPEFVRGVQKLSIPISLFSYLSEEELNKFKLEYLDLALIVRREIKKKEEIKELKDISIDKLYYKSSKTTLDQGKIYTSKATWLANRSVNHVNEIQPLIDSEETWRELEYLAVLKLK